MGEGKGPVTHESYVTFLVLHREENRLGLWYKQLDQNLVLNADFDQRYKSVFKLAPLRKLKWLRYCQRGIIIFRGNSRPTEPSQFVVALQ